MSPSDEEFQSSRPLRRREKEEFVYLAVTKRSTSVHVFRKDKRWRYCFFFFFSLLSLLPAYTRRSLLDYKDDVGVNDGLNSIAPISLKGVFKIVA